MIAQDTIPLAPRDSELATRDHQWWASESARAGTDWPTLVSTALDLLVAGGVLEPEPDDTMTSWNAPSWRAAAVDYHRDRPSAVEIEPERLARLRRLMDDSVSLERTWNALRSNQPAPKTTVDALMLALRFGVGALAKPDLQRRLSALDRDQLKDVCCRVQAFNATIAEPWSADQAAELISAWRNFHEKTDRR